MDVKRQGLSDPEVKIHKKKMGEMNRQQHQLKRELSQ